MKGVHLLCRYHNQYFILLLIILKNFSLKACFGYDCTGVGDIVSLVRRPERLTFGSVEKLKGRITFADVAITLSIGCLK